MKYGQKMLDVNMANIVEEIAKAKALLTEGNYTCVFGKESEVYTSTERGVKPLMQLLESRGQMTDYVVADKVVGKAAAYLYVLLNVKKVYAVVLSTPAKMVFEKYGIDAEAETEVEAIRNRTNTGFCPMEQAVKNVEAIEEVPDILRETLKKLQKQGS